jgi:hypothetical protein
VTTADSRMTWNVLQRFLDEASFAAPQRERHAVEQALN